LRPLLIGAFVFQIRRACREIISVKPDRKAFGVAHPVMPTADAGWHPSIPTVKPQQTSRGYTYHVKLLCGLYPLTIHVDIVAKLARKPTHTQACHVAPGGARSGDFNFT
jgi:hypothetical protein